MKNMSDFVNENAEYYSVNDTEKLAANATDSMYKKFKNGLALKTAIDKYFKKHIINANITDGKITIQANTSKSFAVKTTSSFVNDFELKLSEFKQAFSNMYAISHIKFTKIDYNKLFIEF